MPQGIRRDRLPRTNRKSIARRKQRQVEEEEYQLYKYQESCFKGVALVRLSDLSVGQNASRYVDDQQNVKRLSQILRKQGCFRLNQAFHVPVVIEKTDWDGGRVWLQDGAHGPDPSLRRLCKSPDYTLLALDQESLLTAAKTRFRELEEYDPWWLADVYVTDPNSAEGLDEELIRTLRENFHKERFPSDGRIYQSIRFYQGVNGGRRNKTAENFWWAVLRSEPGSRKADYLRILPRPLVEAFDALLPIKGLWAGMSLGVLHKLRAMKCDEPIICYLEHIHQTFLDLVGRADRLALIDAVTVRILQSRAPKVSTRDLEFLDREKGKLFKYIESEQDRNEIWERLVYIEFPIPTLKTFFQDVLFLDVGQSIMRHLCCNPLDGERSIDKTLKEQYTGDQQDPTLNASMPLLPRNGVEGHLWDLWRFSLQYAFEMTKRKDHRRRVPRKLVEIERAHRLGLQEENESTALGLWHHFYGLARSRGFRFPFADEGPAFEIPIVVQSDFPPEEDQDIDIERRCGKPFTDTVDADRYALSREALLHPSARARVSAASVRQSVFQAFFSYLSPPGESTSRPDRIYDDPEVLLGPESPGLTEQLEAISQPSPTYSAAAGAGLSQPEYLQHITTPQRADSLAPSFGPIRRRVQITHFNLEISIFERVNAIRLPFNRPALNSFFESLDAYEFHIHISNPEGSLSGQNRTISYLDCYPLYLHFPGLTLRAVYCEGCPRHPAVLSRFPVDAHTANTQGMANAVWAMVEPEITRVISAEAGILEHSEI